MKPVRIIQASPARTASTVVINVLMGLMGHKHDPVIFYEHHQEGPKSHDVIKTHITDLQWWVDRFGEEYDLYFVCSERGPWKISDEYRSWPNVAIFQYEELLETADYSEEDIVRCIADRIDQFSEPTLMVTDPVDRENAVHRLSCMNARYKEIKSEPFEFIDPFYHIHGSHRGRHTTPLKPTVTVGIPTLGRYDTTLTSALLSILHQTYTPTSIFLYDDNPNPRRPLFNHEPFKHIVKMLELKGIELRTFYSEKIGLVAHRQHLLNNATTDLVWIYDDDHYAESDVLGVLVETICQDDTIGAVGSLIPQPMMTFGPDVRYSSDIVDSLIFNVNSQWVMDGRHDPYQVEHLHSGFLYRREAGAHGYPPLSPVSHREDTLFSYMMHDRGWKLMVNPSVITWHMRTGGGIREFSNMPEAWASDDDIFKTILHARGFRIPPVKLLPIEGGIGDHFMLKTVLPEIRQKYQGWRIIIAAGHREVFNDVPEEVVSFGSARCILGREDMTEFSPYYQAKLHGHKGPFIDVFRLMYVKGSMGEVTFGKLTKELK
jgi:hypothetical protein